MRTLDCLGEGQPGKLPAAFTAAKGVFFKMAEICTVRLDFMMNAL